MFISTISWSVFFFSSTNLILLGSSIYHSHFIMNRQFSQDEVLQNLITFTCFHFYYSLIYFLLSMNINHIYSRIKKKKKCWMLSIYETSTGEFFSFFVLGVCQSYEEKRLDTSPEGKEIAGSVRRDKTHCDAKISTYCPSSSNVLSFRLFFFLF